MSCAPCQLRSTNDQWVSTVPIQTFVDDIAHYLPGAPDDLIGLSVLNTSIEFAQKTGLIRRTYYSDVQSGVSDYPFEHAANEELTPYAVEEVLLNNRLLRPLINRPRYEDTRASGAFWHPADGLFVFPTPIEDASNCLAATFIMQPKRTACTLPEWVYQNYANIINDGALATTMLIAGMPWSDRTNAGIYRRSYLEGITRATSYARNGSSTTTRKLRAPRFV
jgi:hypothetical protein